MALDMVGSLNHRDTGRPAVGQEQEKTAGHHAALPVIAADITAACERIDVGVNSNYRNALAANDLQTIGYRRVVDRGQDQRITTLFDATGDGRDLVRRLKALRRLISTLRP